MSVLGVLVERGPGVVGRALRGLPPPPGVVEQSPAHFLHTCTCGAQGHTLVGTQAQFWSGAEASNILGQTLRAKLYKSISTLCEAHSLFNFPC